MDQFNEVKSFKTVCKGRLKIEFCELNPEYGYGEFMYQIILNGYYLATWDEKKDPQRADSLAIHLGFKGAAGMTKHFWDQRGKRALKGHSKNIVNLELFEKYRSY